jgi:hypothetical protein
MKSLKTSHEKCLFKKNQSTLMSADPMQVIILNRRWSPYDIFLKRANYKQFFHKFTANFHKNLNFGWDEMSADFQD